MSIMGTALAQGRYWGHMAADWADFQEACLDSVYLHTLDRFAPLGGAAVLDVGCGSGRFAQLAHGRGARVTGLDASEELVAIARGRTPAAAFDIGEMEELPYGDGTFDLATGFNSFQYAADQVTALAEAGRVVRPGGRVVRMTWGRPEQVEAAAYVAALGSVLPPPPPGAPGTFAMSEPGALEDVMAKAGLKPRERHEVACPWVYADHDAALRGLLASGQAAKAIEHSGLAAVTEAIDRGLAGFRQGDGSYRMENVFHYVVATV
jgi:SAM-dependent methyltransferase